MENFVYPSSFVKAYDYTIVIPCFNQGDRICDLLTKLERVLTPIDRRFLVLVVDDASADNTNSILQNFHFKNAKISLQPILLSIHRGRQAALLEGLSVARKNRCDRFIVMEGDGSDNPEAIPELLNTSGKDVVFIDKGPKADHLIFWVIYRFHQLFFWLLTSKEIDFNHYSLINKKAVDTLLNDPFLHYTTALHNRDLTIGKLRLDSPMRKFKQEYRELFQHSTLALLEFGEELLNIFLKFSLSLGFLFSAGLFTAVYNIYFAGITLPNWSIFALVGLFNGFILSIGFFAISVMVLNQKRQHSAMTANTNAPTGRQFHENHLIQPIKDPTRLN